ncbi:unnamed protein product [Closterium sp. NIES-64]|nr:unnamed protein product [Closterium sp. NIES-64]
MGSSDNSSTTNTPTAPSLPTDFSTTPHVVDLSAVPIFTGEHFSSWRFKLKVYMTERNLWGFFDGSASKPTSDASTAEKEAWVRKDKKAFAFLVSKLSLQLVPIVSPCIDRDDATREAWKRLEGEHVSKSLHSKLQARLDFFTVRMKDGESMRAYVNRVEELGERLVELDASVEDNDWIMTLLAGLGEAWSTVITVLDGTQDTWKKEQVVARLINEEARRAKLHGDAIGAAHFSRDAKAKGSGHFKRRNDGNNRGISNGSAAASSSSRGGSANANRARAREGACRFCKKTGHWWRDCPVKPANWRPSSSDDNRRAHVATCDNNDREFVFVASGTTVGGVDAWVLDTGATQHMTASATLLNNVTTVAPVKRVMFGNRDTLDVTGQGDLRLMVDGGPLTIKNVLVVPGLGANLLSVSQFTRKGMRVNIEGTTMALSTADGVHIGTARQAGGLFMLDALPSMATAQAATSTTTLSTWHNRGTKPDVTDLRTFGCTCYYHVPDATRTKLEAKARVAMYLGPSADHKAWRVWDLEHGKLVVSRDVVFYEDTFPSTSMHVPSVIIVPPPLDAADEVDVAPTASPPRTSEGENGSGAVGVSADEEHAKESDPSSPPPKITPTLASTRTRRTPRPNSKLDGYSLVAGDDEGGGDAMCLEAYTDTPSTYQGAMSSAEAAEWERALQEEYDSLMANDVYELVPMPPGAYLVGSRWTLVADVKTKLAAEFSMRDLGAVSHYLGMHIDRDRGNKTLALHQHKYLESVVDRFGMIESKHTPTPMEAAFHPLAVSDEKPMDPESAKTFHSVVGSCMYAAVSTRPDLSFPVGVLGRVVSNPMVEHVRASRRLLRYIKGTTRMGLHYEKGPVVCVGCKGECWKCGGRDCPPREDLP